MAGADHLSAAARPALAPIDAEALGALARRADEQPRSTARVLSVRTECDGGFVNRSYVRDLAPMVVDEPPGLLGTDSAPNPSEAALAALGSCISVGIVANATARGIALEAVAVELEGDIDTAAVWGVAGRADRALPGFSAVRVRVHIKADAPPQLLDELQRHAIRFSPVVNTFTRPVALTSELICDE